MLMIERLNAVLAELGTLPAASRVGVVVIVIAGVTDVAVHLFGADPGAHDHGFAAEHLAHLMGIAGMVLVLAGVIAHGARRHHRRATGGLDRNAPR